MLVCTIFPLKVQNRSHVIDPLRIAIALRIGMTRKMSQSNEMK